MRGDGIQFLKFAVVGASGYGVNLAVFAALLTTDLGHIGAATGAFVIALANNFLWNRHWTFRTSRHSAVNVQAVRFSVVSVVVFLLSLGLLELFVVGGLPALPAQAIAIALGAPISFAAQRVWTFGACDRGSRQGSPPAETGAPAAA